MSNPRITSRPKPRNLTIKISGLFQPKSGGKATWLHDVSANLTADYLGEIYIIDGKQYRKLA